MKQEWAKVFDGYSDEQLISLIGLARNPSSIQFFDELIRIGSTIEVHPNARYDMAGRALLIALAERLQKANTLIAALKDIGR